MSEAPSPTVDLPVPTPSWRKRHPVLARVVLFGVGAGLVGTLLLQQERRREQDAQDRDQARRARLENLVVDYATDPSGATLLKALDEEFPPESVPAHLRALVLRWRGLALAARGDAEACDRAYSLAAMEDHSRRDAGALFVEWARARLELGDAEGALFLLDRPQIVNTGPLGLVTATVRARARTRLGHGVEAQAQLERLLAELPVPLPLEPQDWICPIQWSWSDAATTATEELAALRRPEPLSAAQWERLAAQAPQHFEAQWKAALALEALGAAEPADRAWSRAVSLDPEFAAALLKREAGLRELEARRRAPRAPDSSR